MTPDREALRRAAEKATKGKRSWTYDRCNQPTNLLAHPHEYILSAQADIGDYGLSCDPWMDVSPEDETFIALATPDAVLALLSERDALQARAEKAETALADAQSEMSKYAREAGEAKGRLEASELAGVVEGWKERAETVEAKLAQAVEVVKKIAALSYGYRDTGWGHQSDGYASGLIDASNIAKTFLATLQPEERQ